MPFDMKKIFCYNLAGLTTPYNTNSTNDICKINFKKVLNIVIKMAHTHPVLQPREQLVLPLFWDRYQQLQNPLQ